jgi:ribonuclease HI
MTFSKTIQSIYTDGACSGNPGPGGWAAVAYFKDGSEQTEPILLYTDSEYVKNGITQWVKGWKKKGWKTSTGKPVLNQDLWEVLDDLNYRASKQVSSLQWQYVRGHSGNLGNDRCDEIARTFSQGKTPHLQQVSSNPENQQSANGSSKDTSNSSRDSEFDTHATNTIVLEAVESSHMADSTLPNSDLAMVDSPNLTASDASDLPREVRVAQLRNMVETLHMADEVARQGYLITSSELADLMDINASAVTSRGDNWVWRNWVVSRVRREGNQILWQLERVD